MDEDTDCICAWDSSPHPQCSCCRQVVNRYHWKLITMKFTYWFTPAGPVWEPLCDAFPALYNWYGTHFYCPITIFQCTNVWLFIYISKNYNNCAIIAIFPSSNPLRSSFDFPLHWLGYCTSHIIKLVLVCAVITPRAHVRSCMSYDILEIMQLALMNFICSCNSLHVHICGYNIVYT